MMNVDQGSRKEKKMVLQKKREKEMVIQKKKKKRFWNLALLESF